MTSSTARPSAPRNLGTVDDRRPREEAGAIPAGTQLGGYRIIEHLGKGAMGSVYRAQQMSLDRVVAVKVMAAELSDQEDFVLRFRREAAALAKVSHPNIVAILDQGEEAPLHYLVMEYVAGPSLRERMKQGLLPVDSALEIALQVGRGLSHIHSRMIIHRDLKPENVLLQTEPEGEVTPKLCDFGLADLLSSSRSYANLTGSRAFLGTPVYMAPEQGRDAGNVDHRADVYSFGVLLYELMTGQKPIGAFEAASVARPGVPVAIDIVVDRALQPDPGQRFESVEDMLVELHVTLPGR